MTPWGQAQQAHHHGRGIWSVATASHGGIIVPLDMLLQMPKELLAFKPWAGAGNYEEDVDWAVPTAAFPQLFSGRDLWFAIETLTNSETSYFKIDMARYLQTETGKIAESKAKEWEATTDEGREQAQRRRECCST